MTNAPTAPMTRITASPGQNHIGTDEEPLEVAVGAAAPTFTVMLWWTEPPPESLTHS